MKTITVHASAPYDICVGQHILSDCGRLTREVNGGSRALIVTDSNVFPLYAGTVSQSLQEAGYAVHTFVFPAGEENKFLNVISQIYAELAAWNITRSDVLIALGGGVTGDMTGFAAATWLRGVDFVQIPTTLLAQVDSSVGGKTGVDIPEGKNLVGAFHQPARVIVDLHTLTTLPQEVFADGLAEIIKAACIKDADLFEKLENGEAVLQDNLLTTVMRSIEIKKSVVEQDEKESGERKLLNFGHTIGHALEKHYHFSTLSHGKAVALGMVILSAAAEKQGLTCQGTTQRIRQVLQQYHLPVEDPACAKDYLTHIAQDKKRQGAQLDLILLRKIGEGFIHRIALDDLSIFLDN